MAIVGSEATVATTVSVSQSTVLSATDLQKSYDGRPALRGLSFTLEAGRVLGFLGPNGAGKTTAIRILTTIIEADSGHFEVAGVSSRYPEQIRRRIGVLPESQGYPGQVTGLEYLAYYARHYGWSTSEAKEYSLALLQEVGMQKRANSLIGTYSRGMRQRLGIARALVNNPVVAFLDEPTLGLDPKGQQELLEMVRRIARERNAGVILCSHLLSEIEGVCDDVVILSWGQVAAKGSMTEVAGQAQRNGVRIHVPSPSADQAQRILEAIPDVKVTGNGAAPGRLQVEFVNGARPNTREDDGLYNGILEALIGAKIPILGFEGQGSRLQDVFLRLTQEEIQ